MQERQPQRPSLRVAFVHPDLGLGGAERLVVDAAVALKELGHQPVIYTAFQDPSRTFAEVVPPSPVVPVRVVHQIFPRGIFGRLQAILAALRCAFIALYVCLFWGCDVAVVDIVSLPVVIFALFRIPVLFYCHYPDKLLAATLHPGSRQSGPKKLYRSVVDGMEAFSLRFASEVVCNSRFTANAFTTTFPRLGRPSVVYPCVAVPADEEVSDRSPEKLLLSLNRYERKKAIGLAVETLAVLAENEPEGRDARLVIAGGYDERIAENVEYFAELERLVQARGLGERVTMLKNIAEGERRQLMRSAVAVLYTPEQEHFGIVPLEAMAEGVAVIAVRSGGPIETVEHGVSGILCESSGAEFAKAVGGLVRDVQQAVAMGRKGRERVQKYFSRQVLGRALQNVLVRVVGR